MNAIIMAAGTSSRFAPLSYEKPKGLLKVKGEILIERQIQQLQEAGIEDITVVTGYKAEQFQYLRAKYGVSLVINEDYDRYNNTSSIIRVLNKLEDTFICSSDNYFPNNVFLEKSEHGYYSALYAEGQTGEYCLTTDANDQITHVNIGGANAWYMVGHVFFHQEFSEKFREILKAEYEKDETKKGYWEDVYIRHIDVLPRLMIHRYQPHEIEEFDSLEELRLFEPTYINHSGCKILQYISLLLNCNEGDITHINVIKKGMTANLFDFLCKKDGKLYTFDIEQNKLMDKE